MTSQILPLAAEFDKKHRADWRALAEKALRGAHFDDTLIGYTEDGLVRGPLFAHDSGVTSIRGDKTERAFFPGRTALLDGRPWHIAALVNHPDVNHSNADILRDLEGGASALIIDPTLLASKSDAQRLLSGVHLDLAPIAVLPSGNNLAAAAVLASAHNDALHVSLGLTDANRAVDATIWAAENAPGWRTMAVNALAAHNAGASPAQELAAMLSQGTAFMRSRPTTMSPDQYFAQIDLYLASSQDGHYGICKFRAARLLWAKLAEEFGAIPSTNINAISSSRMMASTDVWSNMIRLSGACFGAVCGGADTITLLPFTHAAGLATPFARRVSRNLQLMMMEESMLGQVNDPAFGSYTHEALTNELAEAAWDIFREMEAKGGWYDGRPWLARQIAKTNQARQNAMQSGAYQMVGVNQFAKSDVRSAKTLPMPKIKTKTSAAIDTEDFADAVAQAQSGNFAPPPPAPFFTPVRDAEPFESGDAK